MVAFTQPTNKEAELQAIMDGYETAIEKDTWLSEALQKDGIQNAWGARTHKSGKEWEVKIVYWSDNVTPQPLVWIEDKGTTGLTGDMPQSLDEEVDLLNSNDPKQRLSRFLSSNWSMKTEYSVGSRGRGKMIFIGASQNKEMCFESIKSDDGKYVFGRLYLDSNKTMQVEFHEGEKASNEIQKKFGSNFPILNHVGTRIIITKPLKEVAESIRIGRITQSIQLTWWEILSKHGAKIYVGDFKKPVRIDPSPLLPVKASGFKKYKEYINIQIPSNSEGLKIKRICLGYLDGRQVPTEYEGVAIQRSGMNIQVLPMSKILEPAADGKVYGSIEFDKPLDNEMLKLESPEHYSFYWHRGVACKVLKEMKTVAKSFAKEFKILEDERRKTSQQRKDAETAVQRELNKIAKSLGIHGSAFGTSQKGTKLSSSSEEKIKISVPDFRTPRPNGQVDKGQRINGVCGSASSLYKEPLRIDFKVWIHRKDGHMPSGLSKNLNGEIGAGLDPLKVGWDSIDIDDRFEKGHYYLKLQVVSLEDKVLDNEFKISKGDRDKLHSVVSRSFWVDEEPPAKGFFKDIRSQDKGNEKDKYVWWDYDDGYILFYNNEHPKIRDILYDDEKYHDLLMKEGALALWTIVLEEAISNPEEMSKKIRDLIQGVGDTVSDQMRWIRERRSESLWGG